MREYIIMTDSCADLSAAEVADLGVAVVPLHYEMDGVEYINNPDHSERSKSNGLSRGNPSGYEVYQGL